ncbi:MAG: hypothetical protein WCR06_07730 [bacterium]
MITCHGKRVTLADLQRAYLRVCSRLHHPVRLRRVVRYGVQYPGIVGHARQLGVSHPHLWMVLTGKRASRRLMARYRDLVRAKGNF